jgi:hypothetical protein
MDHSTDLRQTTWKTAAPRPSGCDTTSGRSHLLGTTKGSTLNFVGTPDQVAEGLISLYKEAPYDRFCFWGRLPGLSHEQTLKSTRIFAYEVAPKVRDAVESV